MTSRRWQRRVSHLLQLLRIYISPTFGSVHHGPSHPQTKSKEDQDELTHAKKTLENSATLAASRHRQKYTTRDYVVYVQAGPKVRKKKQRLKWRGRVYEERWRIRYRLATMELAGFEKMWFSFTKCHAASP